MRFQAPRYMITYVELDGKCISAQVNFDASPPEPDVGWPGGLDIESVYIQDESVQEKVRRRVLGEKITYTMDVTSQVGDQFGRLMDEIGEHMSGWAEDDRY